MLTNIGELIALIISLFTCISLFIVVKGKVPKSQIKNAWLCVYTCMIIMCVGTIAQITLSIPLNIKPIYFEYFTYIGNCFLSVAIFFATIIFINTKISFKKRYLMLFIIPVASLLVLWTNDLHNLFYVKYDIYQDKTVYGKFLYVYNYYTIVILLISIGALLRYSIKNSSFFSKQAIMVVIAALVPISINIITTFRVINLDIYITPISFTITILLLTFAIFKFNFLNIAPIALQKIVDRISDSYIVVNEENVITDFNATLLKTFKLKQKDIRTKNILEICPKYGVNAEKLNTILNELKETNERKKMDIYIESIERYFTVEISVINQKGQVLGAIILLKDVTQHIIDIKTIQRNQEILMEKERLSALGQMIGGISHNLKTPIFSIAGAMEGILKLTNEINISLGNPQVVEEDYREITSEIDEWIEKVKSHLKYMSDIITAVKGQAVNFNLSPDDEFTIEKFLILERVLMKYELKSAGVEFHIDNRCDEQTVVKGNINSLIQVITNMISNSIQAYQGKQGMSIDMIIRQEGANLIISIQDYGPGLSQYVLDRLFKEMVTTKGKNGSGLGLYMSYSNIRAHFKGDITVETSPDKGTRFNIIIPLR